MKWCVTLTQQGYSEVGKDRIHRQAGLGWFVPKWRSSHLVWKGTKIRLCDSGLRLKHDWNTNVLHRGASGGRSNWKKPRSVVAMVEVKQGRCEKAIGWQMSYGDGSGRGVQQTPVGLTGSVKGPGTSVAFVPAQKGRSAAALLLLWADLWQVLLLGMLLFMLTPEVRGCLKIANLILIFDACEMLLCGTYCGIKHSAAANEYVWCRKIWKSWVL